MTTAEDLNAAAFKFVQGLATDLDRDDLELPGPPSNPRGRACARGLPWVAKGGCC